MYKILIVEDDVTIANSIKNHLDKWGYHTKCVADFHDVTTLFENFCPDLVLMDINLPYFNGFHWCSEIRKVSTTPIIFLSSISDNMNIIMAMNMGGDEYIEKPFDIHVLTAKIQALLRRTYSLSQQKNELSCRELTLNLNNTTLTCNGQPLSLTKNEFMMMQFLLEKQGTVVTRDDLMEHLWGNDEFVDDNTLTVNVTRLRKKLESAGCIDYIKTKKGIGYILE